MVFLLSILSPRSSQAQNSVTGGFEGNVVNAETGEPIAGATVRFLARDAGITVVTRTDSVGNFRHGLLPLDDYEIIISAPGFGTYETLQALGPMRWTSVRPLPVHLTPERESVIDLTTSGQTFVGKWDAFDLWEAPSNWHADSGRLKVNERGVATPRDKAYRSYSDFSLISDIKMVNGVAASFAVHVADPMNYYLIQLTGPNADQPYVLRGFIVRNGILQPWRVIPIDAYRATLQPDKFFEVSMKMTDNKLDVSVTDSETGTKLLLGTLLDTKRTFGVGSVGIAVRDNEQNEIGRFIVSLF